MSNTAMQEQDYEKDVKVDFSIWKRLLSYVFRYKKTAIALMLCNVGIAVIDILYPLMSQYAIDNFVEKGTTAGIGWFIALYIAFIAIQALGVYSFIVKAGKLEMNVSYDMRREAFQKLQELSFSFYDRTAVGYLMARMISDVGSLSEMMAWSFVDLLWASTCNSHVRNELEAGAAYNDSHSPAGGNIRILPEKDTEVSAKGKKDQFPHNRRI